MFDRILLLNDHGETIYFGDIGPDASTLISYFEKKGATKCEPAANPAEWVLNVTSVKATAQSESPSGDTASITSWSEKWKSSQENEEVVRHLGDFNSPPRILSIEQQRSEYATPWSRQLTIVSNRLFQEYWRSPTYVYSKIALCTGVVSSLGLPLYIMLIGSLFFRHSSTGSLFRTPISIYKGSQTSFSPCSS